MASSAIIITNGVETKKVYKGFSWTMALFGILPAIFRADWFTVLVFLPLCFFLGFIPTLIYAFFWNKSYIKNYLEKGWKFQTIPTDVDAEELRVWLSYVELPMFEKV